MVVGCWVVVDSLGVGGFVVVVGSVGGFVVVVGDFVVVDAVFGVVDGVYTLVVVDSVGVLVVVTGAVVATGYGQPSSSNLNTGALWNASTRIRTNCAVISAPLVKLLAETLFESMLLNTFSTPFSLYRSQYCPSIL